MKQFDLKRAIAIGKKEVFHILRDPFTLGAALGIPVFMVVMFGVAIEFNVKEISLAVSDADQSRSSRQLVDTFSSSRYFLSHPTHSATDAIRQITTQEARAALVIPPRFEQDLLAGRGAEAQILVDGSDSSTVGPVLGYVGRIQSIAGARLAGFNPPAPIDVRTRFLFNPELNSRWFVIPGLAVMIMAILSVLLTSLTVAREYEAGSMELLLSTPVQPLEIIVGKLAPYGGLGIVAVIMVYAMARIAFGVPFVGNLAVFGLGFLLFMVAYLAQGLLISVGTRNQQVAMQVAMMSAMLPSQLLSGFVFPIESMPAALHYITMILPARWFMQISRDTFLKGSSLVELSGPFFALGLICLFMIANGTRRFKKDLE
ncbi:MAG TPA: ABC transporter permease [Bdellovibrionota bacterium]|nr:ABC transporter permease [Bdellovibrionota bacterium]